MTPEEFLTILVVVFSLVMILAGVFTSYFGSGKSRRVGLGLVGIGLVIGLVWMYLLGLFGDPGLALLESVRESGAWELMYNSILVIVAALVGALAAIGIFLVAVMKS
ncbi:MAG: hypothetical protein FWD37_02065 [Methanomassiliicoccaceae archaeon]|nr:hypothetical protein [Methanomassiliicoccaceae archaeon]